MDLGLNAKTFESSLLSSDQSLIEELKDEVEDSPTGGFTSKGQKKKEEEKKQPVNFKSYYLRSYARINSHHQKKFHLSDEALNSRLPVPK